MDCKSVECLKNMKYELAHTYRRRGLQIFTNQATNKNIAGAFVGQCERGWHRQHRTSSLQLTTTSCPLSPGQRNGTRRRRSKVYLITVETHVLIVSCAPVASPLHYSLSLSLYCTTENKEVTQEIGIVSFHPQCCCLTY